MRLIAILNQNPTTLGSYLSLRNKPAQMTHTVGSVREVYVDKKNRVVMSIDASDYYEYPLKFKIGTKNYIITEVQ